MREAEGSREEQGVADPRAALLAAVKAAFEGDPQSFISQTVDPSSADVLMIGTVVQLYCYADFNGRRIVDVLRHVALGEPRTASRLQDAQVFPMLTRLVEEHLPGGNLRDGLLTASATFEMHRAHRHSFAHWIVRRVRGEDALAMFSMNAREAERREGGELAPQEAKFGILPLEGFGQEVEKLKGHTNYLARTAAWMERNVRGLREALPSEAIDSTGRA